MGYLVKPEEISQWAWAQIARGLCEPCSCDNYHDKYSSSRSEKHSTSCDLPVKLLPKLEAACLKRNAAARLSG